MTDIKGENRQMSNDIKIVDLPKDKWKGTPIPLVTRSDSYYDLEIDPLDRDGCVIFKLTAKPLGNENFHKGGFWGDPEEQV